MKKLLLILSLFISCDSIFGKPAKVFAKASSVLKAEAIAKGLGYALYCHLNEQPLDVVLFKKYLEQHDIHLDRILLPTFEDGLQFPAQTTCHDSFFTPLLNALMHEFSYMEHYQIDEFLKNYFRIRASGNLQASIHHYYDGVVIYSSLIDVMHGVNLLFYCNNNYQEFMSYYVQTLDLYDRQRLKDALQATVCRNCYWENNIFPIYDDLYDRDLVTEAQFEQCTIKFFDFIDFVDQL